MALESATFFVEDYKGRKYKVHAVRDCSRGLDELLWCMVYRALGIGNNPWDYGEMEYEEDYSADFSIYPNDCNCDDEIEVENLINELFNDRFWMDNWIKKDDDLNKSLLKEEKETNEEIAKDVLIEYHSLNLENMAVADALDKLSLIAEKMADVLTDLVYDE